MVSSQGSSFSTSVAGLVEGSAIDSLPVYVKELIAGGAAGAFAKTAVAPLERIKILLQTRTQGFHTIGVYQALKRLLKHEGLPGFYKGNGASVLRIVPYAALHFMTYEQYRCWILDNYTVLGTGPVVDLLAGSAAGGTAVLCTYPLDLARTKLAYQVADAKPSVGNGAKSIIAQPQYSGIKNVLQSVYKEGGMRGLYRGVGPTLIGILPYAGLKFYIYEELKRRVPEEQQKSITMRLSCGALAGLLGQTVTYPLDVVRRQMQVENMQASGSARHKNTWKGLTTIVSEQGWRQLFAGLSINYIKLADAKDVIEATKRIGGARFPVLTPNLKGLEAALAAGVKEVAVFAAASESFSRSNINCSIDESLSRYRDVASAAEKHSIPVRGYISCVVGCPMEGAVHPSKVAYVAEELVKLGCAEISLGDTIGVGTPGTVIPMIEAVKNVVPIEKLAVHFHDTYGQALSNILISLQMGICVVDSSVSGLGGCPYAKGATGNVATEDVVYMLNGLGVKTNVDLRKLMLAGDFIRKQLGRPSESKAAVALSKTTFCASKL